MICTVKLQNGQKSLIEIVHMIFHKLSEATLLQYVIALHL